MPKSYQPEVCETMNLFVSRKLPNLGLNFKVWEWNKPQLFGIVLGSFVQIGLVPDDLTLSTILEFIIDVDKGYFDNPYHSFLHAVDVLYMMYYILIDLNVAELMHMNKMEITSLLIAALTHDILHPGLNNLYHVNAHTDVAAKYNNRSVLENLSCDRLKELLDKHSFIDRLNYGHVEEVFDSTGAKVDQLDYMKIIIMDAILNTDMCFHFNLLKQLSEANKETFTDTSSHEESIPLIIPFASEDHKLQPEPSEDVAEVEAALERLVIFPSHVNERRRLINILLHAADISNAARPFEICKKWSDMIVEEFFLQGEQEMRMGIPISPSMDRASTSQVKISVQFNDLIALPFFQALELVVEPIKCYVEILKINRIEWISRMDVKEFAGQESDDDSLESDENAQSVAALVLASRTGRRMSTAAGTLDIPVRRVQVPSRHMKRHSFCALSPVRKRESPVKSGSAQISQSLKNDHL